VNHLAVGLQPPRFAPFWDQPPQRSIRHALLQHPPQPGLVNGVEAPLKVGFHHEAVPPAWQLARERTDRIERANLGPIPRAASQEILRRDGVDSTRDRTLHQRIVHGRHPHRAPATVPFRVYVRVTVTQRATGVVAEGHTLLTRTGDTQQWEVHASVQGQETFEGGLATAVALARTSDRRDITDAHQWLVDITLVGE
jgi:hypothetical protein